MRHMLAAGILLLMLCLVPAFAQDVVDTEMGEDVALDEATEIDFEDEMELEGLGEMGEEMGMAMLPLLMMMMGGMGGEMPAELMEDAPLEAQMLMQVLGGGDGGINPLLLMMMMEEGGGDMEEILPLLLMSGSDIDPLMLMMMMDGGGAGMEEMMFLQMMSDSGPKPAPVTIQTDDYILIIEDGKLYKINWRTMELEGSVNYGSGGGGGMNSLLPLLLGAKHEVGEIPMPALAAPSVATTAEAEEYIYVPSGDEPATLEESAEEE